MQPMFGCRLHCTPVTSVILIIRKALKEKRCTTKSKTCWLAGGGRRFYGCICRWWLGCIGNQHTDLQKKKSSLCNWFGLSRRVFCGLCECGNLFYFTQTYSHFRCARTDHRRYHCSTHCRPPRRQTAFKNHVLFSRRPGNINQPVYFVEGA